MRRRGLDHHEVRLIVWFECVNAPISGTSLGDLLHNKKHASTNPRSLHLAFLSLLDNIYVQCPEYTETSKK